MDTIDPNQICSICGKVISIHEMHSNTLFEESRCDSCYNTYGAVPLETLKAQIISVYGLKIEDIPQGTWHELIMLQIKKQALKSETEEKITRAKGSLLSIGKDSKIEKIKQEAVEARNKIDGEIEALILISVHGLKIKDIPADMWHELIALQIKKQAVISETKGRISKAKESPSSIDRGIIIEKIKQEAAEERKKINQEIEDLIIEIKSSKGREGRDV